MDNLNKLLVELSHPFIIFYWRVFKPKTQGCKALIVFGNQILLTKNMKAIHWSIPGGGIKKGEAPEDCLKRELFEELKLKNIMINYKLGEYFSDKQGKRDTIYVFIVKPESQAFERQWELKDAKWFDLNNLPKDISPAASKRVQDYVSGQKNLTGNW